MPVRTATAASAPPGAASPPAAAPKSARAVPPADQATSLDLQPGEIELGSWTVNIDRGRLLTGKLRVTDRRIMFRPQVGGVGLIGMLQTQRTSYKDAHTIVLGKDQILSVEVEKGLLTKKVHVTDRAGAAYVFGCGPGSVDAVAQAIRQR